MTHVSEPAEKGHPSQEAPKPSMLAIGLMMIKVLRRNPGVLKNVIVMRPDEPRYVRPPREYDLPAYREGMKHCVSNEKYLRPTRWCNPREPLVIAMANELGAYELSDWEFADAAYWFVKANVYPEMVPLDSVSATLERGAGTCMHVTSLWVALCRAAGIKARYKTFKPMMDDALPGMGVDWTQMAALDETGLGETEQEMLPNVFNALPGPGHGQGEACIDGKWVVGDVAMRPEMHATGGVPITKFGEDAIDSWGWRVIPGTIERFESLPLIQGIMARVMMPLISAAMERSAIALVGMVPPGRKIIEEAGGMEAYDRKARERLKHTDLTVEVEPNEAIVFGEG